MNRVKLDLCANDKPIINYNLEDVDASQYSIWVDPTDLHQFARHFTFLLGGAHGIMRTAAAEGNTFSIEVTSDLTEEQVRAVEAALKYTVEFVTPVLGGKGFTLDLDRLGFIANPLVRH